MMQQKIGSRRAIGGLPRKSARSAAGLFEAARPAYRDG
jgi:hypothetical protein